jgi:flagellin-like hook-associated protein FlgL
MLRTKSSLLRAAFAAAATASAAIALTVPGTASALSLNVDMLDGQAVVGGPALRLGSPQEAVKMQEAATIIERILAARDNIKVIDVDAAMEVKKLEDLQQRAQEAADQLSQANQGPGDVMHLLQ